MLPEGFQASCLLCLELRGIRQDWPLEGSFRGPRELRVPMHSEPKSQLIGHLRLYFPASSDRYIFPSKETLKCRLKDILPRGSDLKEQVN